MSAYVIDFSDPLKNGFSIPAGGFNGPGGSSANTTLRLYGRGALEWGEAVNEDLVRLTENFASASPPSIAIGGQLWAEVFYYYHDDNLGLLSGWYFYNINSVLSNKWELVSGTGNVPSAAPLTPVEGQYYYTTTGGDPVVAPFTPLGTLRGYYSLGKYEPATWVVRAFMSGIGAPSSGNRPDIRLRIRDAAQGTWASPVTTTVLGSTPSNPTPGMLWYNTVTGNLNLRTNVGTWQEILGPSNGTSASRATGPVDMGDGTTNYQINNLLDPTSAQDAATRAYVDSAVAGGIGGAGFLPLTGGTLSVTTATGLVVNRTNSATNSAIQFQTTGGSVWVGQGATGVFAVDDDSSLSGSPWLTATASAMTAAGSLTTGTSLGVGTSATTGTSLSVGTTLSVGSSATVGGQLNMSSNKIINLATGTNANDAVNVAQMNAAIAAGSISSSVPIIYSSGTYKAGDIAILTGPVRIYIASAGGSGAPPGGNWRQVFPAVYG